MHVATWCKPCDRVMACCRCNRSGRCQNCLCVKSGRPCQGCLPQRLGNCVNTVRTPPPTNLAPLSAQPQNSTPRSSSPSPCVPDTPPCCTAPEFTFELPAFSPAIEPTFTWGPCVSVTFINSLNAAYSEVVHWRPNVFKLVDCLIDLVIDWSIDWLIDWSID